MARLVLIFLAAFLTAALGILGLHVFIEWVLNTRNSTCWLLFWTGLAVFIVAWVYGKKPDRV